MAVVFVDAAVVDAAVEMAVDMGEDALVTFNAKYASSLDILLPCVIIGLINNIRYQFPMILRVMHGVPMVYLLKVELLFMVIPIL